MKDGFNIAGRSDEPDKESLRSSSPNAADVEKYKKLLDGNDMTDAQKVACIKDVWSCVDEFVMRSFGINPIQNVCGQVAANSPDAPKDAFNRVSSKDQSEESKPEGRKP